MDGWEECRVEEVLTHGLHVQIHQSGGEAGCSEQGARLVFSLDLQLAKGRQKVRFLFIKPATILGSSLRVNMIAFIVI